MENKKQNTREFAIACKAYAAVLARSNVLSREREVEMFKEMASLEAGGAKYIQLRNKIVEHCQRLVFYEAKKMFRGYTGIVFDELMQQGALGLMKAATKFDYKKGLQFSTYATYWVRKYLSAYIEGVSKRRGLSAVSLDAPVNNSGEDEDNRVMVDLCASGDKDDPQRNYLNSRLKDMVSIGLKCLSKRERDVVSRVYGLNEQAETSITEQAQERGVTRQNESQILNRALYKIKAHLSQYKHDFCLLNEER